MTLKRTRKKNRKKKNTFKHREGRPNETYFKEQLKKLEQLRNESPVSYSPIPSPGVCHRAGPWKPPSKCSKFPAPPVNMPMGALLGGETKERMRASLSREPSEVKSRSPSCGNTLIKADDFFDRILCYACSGWLQTCGFSFS